MNEAHTDLLKLARSSMPYGKHKGTLLIDLPEHYVVWYYSKGLPEGELGKLLGLLYEIKLNGLEYLVRPLKT
ncbi:MAG: hypothetical protein ACJAS4_001185 [Bacteriovoracaceae bacterium]|jgi:uncharacterized protein (DUF3820 family)